MTYRPTLTDDLEFAMLLRELEASPLPTNPKKLADHAGTVLRYLSNLLDTMGQEIAARGAMDLSQVIDGPLETDAAAEELLDEMLSHLGADSVEDVLDADWVVVPDGLTTEEARKILTKKAAEVEDTPEGT